MGSAATPNAVLWRAALVCGIEDQWHEQFDRGGTTYSRLVYVRRAWDPWYYDKLILVLFEPRNLRASFELHGE